MTIYSYKSFLDSTDPSLPVPVTLPTSANFSINDQLVFDDPTISAAMLKLSITGVDLEIVAGVVTFTLKGFTPSKISSANFMFADSSRLVIGDDNTDTSNDDESTGNLLIGSEYDDYLDGMLGNDTVSYVNATSAVNVDLIAGKSAGGAGSDVLFNIENIIGSPFNDTLTGSASGSRLDGGAGIDVLIGGAGNDTYVVTAGDSITDAGTEDLDTVISNTDYVLGETLENLVLAPLAPGAGIGIGNAKTNVLTGNEYDNILDGGSGTDTLEGGLGNDTYLVDDPGDKVIERAKAGTDLILSTATSYSLTGTGVNDVENLRLLGTESINATGNTLNNLIYANSGSNILIGDRGVDTLSYRFGATAGVTVDLAKQGPQATVGSGTDDVSEFEWLEGSRYDDHLSGNSGDNDLKGDAGNDTLVGATGKDTLRGGTGTDSMVGGGNNDVYYVDNAGDIVIENPSSSSSADTVYANIHYALGNNVENLILDGTTALNGLGNSLNNKLTGNDAKNELEGAAGDDLLLGMKLNDTLYGGDGNDTLVGGQGKDVLYGNAGSDIFRFANGVLDTSVINGIDACRDLELNAGIGDRLDLSVVVDGVDSTPVLGTLSSTTFIANMDALLAKTGEGFTTAGAITAGIVRANSGDLVNKDFLAVDLDGNKHFTDTDFVIEITGATLVSLTTATFI